jgi:hypothetical protein
MNVPIGSCLARRIQKDYGPVQLVDHQAPFSTQEDEDPID